MYLIYDVYIAIGRYLAAPNDCMKKFLCRSHSSFTNRRTFIITSIKIYIKI